MASRLYFIGILPHILVVLPYILFFWVTFCHAFPIYRVHDQGITLARLQRYTRWVFKVWLIATCGYSIICLVFALLMVSAPFSRLTEILTHLTECAHRFNLNDCGSQKWVCPLMQKECFALVMCVSQPRYLIVTHEILLEWGNQLWNSFSWFIALVSLYILITARFPEVLLAGPPESPRGPPPLTPPHQIDLSNVAPGSVPGIRLQPPSPEQRLHRHDRPDSPFQAILQAGVPSPPQERGSLNPAAALPGNRVANPNDSEGRRTSSSENTTLIHSEEERDMPNQLRQSPVIPTPATRSYVELLHLHRLMILPQDMLRGPAFALPRGALTAGSGDPPDHMVDERGARFRIRDLQENILTPEEVLRILEGSPPPAQPIAPPNDEDYYIILDAQRQFFQTNENARSNVLVQNNMFPIPVDSFAGGPMHLPHGTLRANPLSSPHAMADSANRVFVVYDQEDQPVDPVRVRAILAAERTSQAQTFESGDFMTPNRLTPVAILGVTEDGRRRTQVRIPQGMLLAVGDYELRDPTGTRFLVFRNGNWSDVVTSSEVLRLQTELVRRSLAAQATAEQERPPGDGTAATDRNGAANVIPNAPSQATPVNINGDEGQEDPAAQNNENGELGPNNEA